MKKDKLKNIFNKKIIVFYAVIFIIALISGAFFGLILNDKDSLLVLDHFKEFYSIVKNGNINYVMTLLNTFILNSTYILIIWILSYFIIGIPIVLLIYFFKVFVIGFTISSFVINFKIKGILYSFLYLFPHTIINITIITLISMVSIIISLKLLNTIIKKKKINLFTILKKHFLLLIIMLLLIFITSAYETFLVPKVFNLII